MGAELGLGKRQEACGRAVGTAAQGQDSTAPLTRGDAAKTVIFMCAGRIFLERNNFCKYC